VLLLRFNLRLLAQNGIWVKFYHFWPKKDGEKWSRKKYFLNSSMRKPFSSKVEIFLEEREVAFCSL
jgi:hypothetical protein